jgi:hypothetical protein
VVGGARCVLTECTAPKVLAVAQLKVTLLVGPLTGLIQTTFSDFYIVHEGGAGRWYCNYSLVSQIRFQHAPALHHTRLSVCSDVCRCMWCVSGAKLPTETEETLNWAASSHSCSTAALLSESRRDLLTLQLQPHSTGRRRTPKSALPNWARSRCCSWSRLN